MGVNTEAALRLAVLGPDNDLEDWRQLGKTPHAFQEKLRPSKPRRRSKRNEDQTEPFEPSENWEPVSRWPNPVFTFLRLTGLVWGFVGLCLLPIFLLMRCGVWVVRLVRKPEEDEEESPPAIPWFQIGKAPVGSSRANFEDAALLGGFVVSQALFVIDHFRFNLT